MTAVMVMSRWRLGAHPLFQRTVGERYAEGDKVGAAANDPSPPDQLSATARRRPPTVGDVVWSAGVGVDAGIP